MTQAPPPATLAKFLRQVANQLETHGDKASELAALLAARGYPTGGSGDGSRSSDSTSSTERAALVGAPNGDGPWHEGEWDDADTKLARYRRALWVAALDYQALHANVCAHASDDDPIPIGRGECQACGKFCKGDGGNDRLRSGLCNGCTQRWRRYRLTYPNAMRSDFITDTKRELLSARRA